MKSARTQTGMSILEALIAVAVFAIAMGAVVSSVLFFYRANRSAIEQAFAIDSGRKGVSLMVRDIREAAFADDGSFPVSSFGTSTLTLYSDVDRDSSVERVRYFLEGTNLKKGHLEATGNPLVYDPQNETVSVVSDSVRNGAQGVPVFTYFTQGGSQITDFTAATTVSRVTVNLIININDDTLPGDFTLRSSAALRNNKK